MELAPKDLAPDCTNCFGLCCVALPFAKSSDFAIDKRGGDPCTNLTVDYSCSKHSKLREIGFRGCTVFDCFGAGQHVSQGTFEGRSWRESPSIAGEMFEVFPVMRGLHELLWYLTQVRPALAADSALLSAVDALTATTTALTDSSVRDLLAVDLGRYQAAAGELLSHVSEVVRARVSGRGADRRGQDLAGADLSKANLRGASLRGTLLIAANLSGADLTSADLLGADLRDANLRGANLLGALFITQPQLAAAIGDESTKLPDTLARPAHWLRRD